MLKHEKINAKKYDLRLYKTCVLSYINFVDRDINFV